MSPRHADFAADPLDEMDAILAKIAGVRLAAVISSDDYPGSALAAAIAKRLGLPGPDPAVTLICQHKYLARRRASRSSCRTPCRLLPSSMSPRRAPSRRLALPALRQAGEILLLDRRRARRLSLRRSPRSCRAGRRSINSSCRSTGCFSAMPARAIGTKRLIAEGVLKGEQVTVEGFVHDGKATIMGVVELGDVPRHARLRALRLSLLLARGRAAAHGRDCRDA